MICYSFVARGWSIRVSRVRGTDFVRVEFSSLRFRGYTLDTSAWSTLVQLCISHFFHWTINRKKFMYRTSRWNVYYLFIVIIIRSWKYFDESFNPKIRMLGDDGLYIYVYNPVTGKRVREKEWERERMNRRERGYRFFFCPQATKAQREGWCVAQKRTM